MTDALKMLNQTAPESGAQDGMKDKAEFDWFAAANAKWLKQDEPSLGARAEERMSRNPLNPTGPKTKASSSSKMSWVKRGWKSLKKSWRNQKLNKLQEKTWLNGQDFVEEDLHSEDLSLAGSPVRRWAAAQYEYDQASLEEARQAVETISAELPLKRVLFEDKKLSSNAIKNVLHGAVFGTAAITFLGYDTFPLLLMAGCADLLVSPKLNGNQKKRKKDIEACTEELTDAKAYLRKGEAQWKSAHDEIALKLAHAKAKRALPNPPAPQGYLAWNRKVTALAL